MHVPLGGRYLTGNSGGNSHIRTVLQPRNYERGFHLLWKVGNESGFHVHTDNLGTVKTVESLLISTTPQLHDLFPTGVSVCPAGSSDRGSFPGPNHSHPKTPKLQVLCLTR